MLHWLRRHHVPIAARFEFSLVLAYALPAPVLEPLLAPGLALDRFEHLGFLAVALVQVRELRPAALPSWIGRRFLFCGYRLFVRFVLPNGRRLRGLQVLRSDTDSRVMVSLGNLLTHYSYHLGAWSVERSATRLDIEVRPRDGCANLTVSADLSRRPGPLPEHSPFPDLPAARRFAGPMPFTFDYERETHSMVAVQGARQHWEPQSVAVNVTEVGFLSQPAFAGVEPILANAFFLENVPYLWKRGVRHPLPPAQA